MGGSRGLRASLPGMIRYAPRSRRSGRRRGVASRIRMSPTAPFTRRMRTGVFVRCRLDSEPDPIQVAAPMKAASTLSVRLRGQDRAAIQASFLGGGRAYLRGVSYTTCLYARFPIRAQAIMRAARRAARRLHLDGPNAYELTAMSPAERIQVALDCGAQIHPQYRAEFENGVSVAWHRVPFTSVARRVERCGAARSL